MNPLTQFKKVPILPLLIVLALVVARVAYGRRRGTPSSCWNKIAANASRRLAAARSVRAQSALRCSRCRCTTPSVAIDGVLVRRRTQSRLTWFPMGVGRCSGRRGRLSDARRLLPVAAGDLWHARTRRSLALDPRRRREGQWSGGRPRGRDERSIALRMGDGRMTPIGMTSSFPTLPPGPGVWRS